LVAREESLSGSQRWIRTERLRLRPACRADAPALHALWTEPQVRRFLWDDVAIPPERAAEVVEDSATTFAERGLGQWLVFEGSTDELAGFAGLRVLEATGDVELLYGLYPRCWGRGLATEASRALLRYGFEELGLARIVAGADEPNLASLRVIERLGMRYERRLPCPLGWSRYYALTREAFLARTACAQDDRGGPG
jgi:RimJ/RimL family protein N-acetyltransferase